MMRIAPNVREICQALQRIMQGQNVGFRAV
jgi:hypothetical protein